MKRLLLKATEYNWSLIGPGDWKKTVWNIYYDGSYEMTSYFMPLFGGCEPIKKIKVVFER